MGDAAGILIPILVPLGLFALIFGIFYMRNRERMAMIERGMDPRLYRPQAAPYQNLKWGLLLIGAGFGLFVAYLIHHLAFGELDDVQVIYFGLVGIFGGLGLFATYRIEKKETLEKE